MLAVTWADIATAGAFVLGIVVGGIGAIRVFRYTLEYMSRRDERE